MTFLLLLVLNFPIACHGDWSNSFLLQSRDGVNPGMRVGFNPQPEPPGQPSFLDLNDSTNPIVRIPDIRVSNGFARIQFGVSAPYSIDATGDPVEGSYQFLLHGDTDLTVEFEMFTESGGVVIPGTWEGFNPQPEPPGLGINPSSIGFDFQFASNGEMPAFLSFQILDGDQTPISLTSVPEPGSISLLTLAMGGIMFRRRRR